MLLNCGVGEDSGESLGLQGYQTNQSERKSTLNIYLKDSCWSWSSNTLPTWWGEVTPWKRFWYWERLRAGKGVTEDEKVWWHHQLNGHELEQTLKDSEKKPGVLKPMGSKDLDMTEWLNNFYWRETIQQSPYNKIQVFDVWYLLWIPRLAF